MTPARLNAVFILLLLFPAVGGWSAPGGRAQAGPDAEIVQGPIQLLDDAAGDGVGRPYTLLPTGEPCQTDELPPDLATQCQTAWDGALNEATPAPPELDILGVSLTEQRRSIRLDLELASVDPSLAWGSDGEAYDEAWFFICWGAGATHDECMGSWNGPNFVWIYAGVEPTGGRRYLAGQYWGFGPSCSGEGYYCGESPNVWLAPGKPGSIVVEIGRATFAQGAGEPIADIYAWIYRIRDVAPPGSGLPSLSARVEEQWTNGRYTYELVDEAAGRAEAEILAPRPRPEDLTYLARIDDPADDLIWGSQSIVDLAGVRLEETPHRVTIGVQFQDPIDGELMLGVSFGFADAPSFGFYEALRADSAEATGWICRSPDDETRAFECDGRVPVAVDVSENARWANVTISRGYMPGMRAGSLLTTFYVYAQTYAPLDPALSSGAADVFVADESAFTGDHIVGAPIVWLRHDTAAPSPTEAQSIRRWYDDTPPEAIPDLAAQGRSRQFDLRYVEILAETPRGARVAVQVRDLSRETIPETYDGFFLAAAGRTSAGDVMFGYYKGDGAPTGQFFCAPDTSLFQPQPSDPMGRSLVAIEGEVLPPLSPYDRTGSYIMWVPAACFARQDPLEIRTENLAAGSFLVRNPQHRPGAGIVTAVDRLDVEEPLMLYSTASGPAAPAANWRSRLTDTTFVGAALAFLAVAAVAVVLVSRRPASAPAAASADRLTAYERVLSLELDSGRAPKELATRLKPVRAALSVSDTEHARLEAALRAQRAGALGVARELVPRDRFLDRYEVVLKLGTGGEASTYLCRDERLGREVVLKVLRFAAGGQADQVLREARAFGKVRHENVVMIYDVEQVADEIFLVLEHIEGGTLKDRIGAGPLQLPAFRQLARDLLAALAAVHSVGIVHRDVKPSNVLVTPAGRFKLADFGIAHVPGYENTLVSAGKDSASGTLPYMSPEQARGHKVDPRSDLYSTAATLLEAWTGRPYIEARDDEGLLELQLRVASGKGSFEHFIGPPELKSWFVRALDPDAQGRFASAQGMMGVLGLVLGGVRDASAAERTRGAVRK